MSTAVHMHPNSLAANADGEGDGAFSKRELMIMEFARSCASPFTDRDAMLELGFSEPNAVRPRITRLVQNGHLEEVDSVRCAVTGKTVRRLRIPEAKESQSSLSLE